MSDIATLAVTLSPEAAERLATIAEREHSTPDALAALAVADFLEREAAVVAAIERGQAEIRAGLGIPHEQVMRDIRELIEATPARP